MDGLGSATALQKAEIRTIRHLMSPPIKLYTYYDNKDLFSFVISITAA